MLILLQVQFSEEKITLILWKDFYKNMKEWERECIYLFF